MKKIITISEYLKENDNKLLKVLLSNYSLKDVSISLFFKYFENKVSETPEDVANFILDEKNGYELSVFGYRSYYHSVYPGIYSGLSTYKGFKSTRDAKNYNNDVPKKRY